MTTMKRGLLVLGVLVWLASWTRAEDFEANPLVTCGTETVVVFANTVSEDERYALAWTIRPNQKKEPVDWSSYVPLDFYLFRNKYNFVSDLDQTDHQDYQLVNGVVDLAAKRFTPLPSKNPYYPDRVRAGISAAWSDKRRGARYALVAIDTQLETDDLWLLTLDAPGLKPLSLTDAADKAVIKRMRKRDPWNYKYYATSYEPGGGANLNSISLPVFRKDSVTIPFYTDVPRSGPDGDQGKITFALPKGNVLRLGFDKK